MNADTMEMTVIESNPIHKDSTAPLLAILDQKYFDAKETIVILASIKFN